jgi:hypothetical protein
MKKTLISGAVLVATVLIAQQAQAQCGVGFGISICGGVYVNTPPVYVQPVPQVVYAPPPQVVYTPPPQVIYTPPPQPVYVQSAPVYIETQPVQVVQTVQLEEPRIERPYRRHRGFGFGARVGGGYAGLSDIGMYGGGINLRYTASPSVGIELTVDAFGGTGYAGAERTEFPITLNVLWYLNPRSRFQVYILGGLGISIAEVEQNGYTDDPLYGGGEIGLGLELLLGNHFGITLDARGFVRTRMNEREEGNLAHDGSCRTGDDGQTECTDLEAGAVFNLGVNFYI